MQDAVSIAVAPAPPSRLGERLRIIARNAFPFIVVGAIWEAVARSGTMPPKLFPTLGEIATSFVELTISGILPHHALDTIIRLLVGFGMAAVAGLAIGMLMGRSRRMEDICLPLVSILAPIPGLAYTPLFLLWFGPGQFSAVLLVAFVSMFPVIYNCWTGVKAVKEVWAALHPHRLQAGAGAGLAHPGRGGNARRRALGARLADLRRARIPQYRRHDGRRRRDRDDRPGTREARV
jgi:hypothetical protein